MRVYGFNPEENVLQGLKSTATYTRTPARTSTPYRNVALATSTSAPMAKSFEASHRVESGENLTRIVRDFLQKQGESPSNSTVYKGVRDVATHNRLSNANLIHPGQNIDLSILVARSAVAESLPLTTPTVPLVISAPLPAPLGAVAAKTVPVDPLRNTDLTRSARPLKIQGAALPAPIPPQVEPAIMAEKPIDIPNMVDGAADRATALQQILNGTADSLALIQTLLDDPGSTDTETSLGPWASVLKGGARLSSDYGMRKDPFTGRLAFHDGIDIAAKRGTEITAIQDGEVIYSGWKGGYGNTVVVRHKDGLESIYGHTAKNSVNVGDSVRAGTVLATVGSTGRSTGPHLHLEMRQHGKSVNPHPHLADESMQLAQNGLGS